MRKKIFVILFNIFIITILECKIYANENQETIKIGYTPNYGIINDPIIKGKEGFGYEYFEEISKYTKHNYEYVPLELKNAFRMLENGEIDLLGPIGKTPERMKLFRYTLNKFGYEDIFLVTYKDTDMTYGDFKDIGTKKIGVETKSSHLGFLKEYTKKHSITPELVPVNGKHRVNEMYYQKYDLMLNGSLSAMNNIKVVEKLGREPFFFISRKNETELIQEIDSAMEKIKKSDHLFKQRLFLKYYSKNQLAKPALHSEELEIIQRKKVYNVGYYNYHQPISYTNKDGAPQGIAIDIMDHIAKKVNMNIKYIPIIPGEIPEEEIDIDLSIIGKYQITDGKSSEPYLLMPMMVIGNSKTPDSEVKSIAVLNYNSIDVDYIAEKFKNIELLKIDNMNRLYEILKNGSADRIVVSAHTADLLLSLMGNKNYFIKPLSVELPLVITIGSHLPSEVYNTMNKLITGVESEYIESLLISNTTKIKRGLPIKELIYKNRYYIALFFIAIIVIYLLTVIYLIRRKKLMLKNLIEVDELTGLSTRYKFIQDSKKILSKSSENEYSIISMDIDNFKYINRAYGYGIGNEILKKFGNCLQKYYGKNTLIAREYNDSFIILTKNSVDSNQWDHLMLEEVKSLLGEDYKLNISKGIYSIENVYENIAHMIDYANTAKFRGKEIYGSTSFEYSEQLKKEQKLKYFIVANMEKALEEKEFFIVYQPKYCLKNFKLIGAEALVRWKNSYGITFYPDQFIPVFESNGFIVRLDYYVLEKVCQLISSLDYNVPRISVNLSRITLLQDNLIEDYSKILNKYNVSADKIEIEITESAIIKNYDIISKRVNDLKNMGFYVSMDDFGSGVSSLNKLQDINVDILKLDKEFINISLSDQRGISIIKNILKLSKDLNLLTVAEGIETSEQLELLVSLGCKVGQGYYFSKPVSEKDFIGRFLSTFE